MFNKISRDISYYIKINEWIWELNENNILNLSRPKIRYLEKKYRNYSSSFREFKYHVMWRWIKKNIELSDKFVANFKKNVNKLKLELSPKEEKMIWDIEEFVFSTWRPLKNINVKFELQPKEIVELYQSNTTLLIWNDDTKTAKMDKNYNIYYSIQRIIFTNKNQEIERFIWNHEIIGVKIIYTGVVIQTNEINYLLRSKNKLLPFAFLENILPKLKLNHKNIVDLYYTMR